MRYFNSDEDYYQYIKNWKALANSGELKSRPHLFMIHNILKDRDAFHGFSENTRQHSLFSINLSLDHELRLYGYTDKRSFILKLFEGTNLDSKRFIDNLRAVSSDIIKKARDIENNINMG
jgi:hypothetical protein